jgi:Fe-S-cluster containining protein
LEYIKFKCERCGYCCETLFDTDQQPLAGLTLLPEEIDRFDSKLIQPFIAKGNTEPTTILLYQLVLGRCPYLSKEKTCKIYRERPLVCKAFPLIYTLGRSDLGAKCPQISHRLEYQEGKLVSFENPQLEETMQILEKKMGELRENVRKEKSRLWIYDFIMRKWFPSDL